MAGGQHAAGECSRGRQPAPRGSPVDRNTLGWRLFGSSVVSRKHAVLHNVLDYAVALKALPRNPLPELKWNPPKSVQAIDKLTLVNHEQARNLLEAVRHQPPSGPGCVPSSQSCTTRPPGPPKL